MLLLTILHANKALLGDVFTTIAILTITVLVCDKELTSVIAGVILSIAIGFSFYQEEDKKQLTKILIVFVDFIYALFKAKSLRDINHKDITTRISTETFDIVIPISKGLAISKLNSIGLQHIISITAPIAWDKDRSVSGINKNEYALYLYFSSEEQRQKALKYLKSKREPFNKAIPVDNENKAKLLTKYKYDVDEDTPVFKILQYLQDRNISYKILIHEYATTKNWNEKAPAAGSVLAKTWLFKHNEQLVLLVLPVDTVSPKQDFPFIMQKLEGEEHVSVLTQQFSVFSNSYVSPLRCSLLKQENTAQIFFHNSLPQNEAELAFLLSPTITI